MEMLAGMNLSKLEKKHNNHVIILNSLVPGRSGGIFKNEIFNLVLLIGILIHENALG